MYICIRKYYINQKMKYNNDNTNGFLIHASAFAGLIFPFGNIITPFIAWQTLKDRSPYLDHHGKEAVNFNISYSIYIFILSAVFVPFTISTFFHDFWNWNNFGRINIDIDSFNIFGFVGLATLAGILTLVVIALTIVAALKAKEGEFYKYPFTIKFIK
tara:strand:+ start:17550 stop:18023 length:474 start_codon:yes stop_codon:yes gene_type:complete